MKLMKGARDENDINDNRTAHIAELLEKYIGGETTMAEEDFLRTYFREHSGDIPAEWKPYRVMFCFVDAERKTVRDETDDIAAEAKPETAGNTVGLHRKVALWLSAAAAVALLLVFFLPSHQSDAVCYMVEDGKCTPTSAWCMQKLLRHCATSVKWQTMIRLRLCG